jgi:hypothetical protein
MMVVRQRAALLSLVLVLALASGACAEQDSREVHTRLQSAAKASSDMHVMFAACASCALAQARPGWVMHPCIRPQDEAYQRRSTGCKHSSTHCSMHGEVIYSSPVNSLLQRQAMSSLVSIGSEGPTTAIILFLGLQLDPRSAFDDWVTRFERAYKDNVAVRPNSTS